MIRPEAVAPATHRPRPHLVLERPQALLANEPAARLEPVAKEVEPLARLLAVADPRLVRMQGQAVGSHPRRYLAQCPRASASDAQRITKSSA